MAKIYPHAYLGGRVVPFADANLSIASSAVLYGLSVYSVVPVFKNGDGLFAFRMKEHGRRIADSARIIGIDTFEWSDDVFLAAMRETIAANEVDEDVFVRVTAHVTELVPGTRSRGIATDLSLFVYRADCILPKDGARLKTSVWRRVPDYAIPSRAKVNGAYVNSVLARQDAIDSGYDDCVFLDVAGHVSELSAANIFLVRDGVLHTPDTASDILEGISRRTVLELARDMGIEVCERTVDLTELYVADEVFASGTSAFLTPVVEIDKRVVNSGKPGPITEKLREKYFDLLHGKVPEYRRYLTKV
ncbi:MAG: branched-chain amino acid aminotransferase [Candidatus Parcubacteria bacterium]|jgi:branched-chain amino acid aminotransferase|nr:branched-chain amino acid aminotransferase [Candidatus Parcubacteria bacterium]